MTDSTDTSTQGIAVIGMSGRFPKARNIAQFWQNLSKGRECISFFSDEELLAAGVHQSTLDDPNYVKAAGYLEDADLFDAGFFGFSPREAEVMDPQQRLFLECAWESLEDAGCDPKTYKGLIGVYAGMGMSTYLFRLLADPDLCALVGSFQLLLGNDKDHLTTHVSYRLDLKGPSVAVQTACSTSLVAVSTACQALLDYQCDVALAGGVFVSVPLKAGYFYRQGGIVSPDGHCRAFDAKAQGTVGGNGLGIVVLKRLTDAVRDGDRIRAVIKGAAINNDGSLKAGYTAPGVDGQAEVIAMAHAMAGIDPATITYVETHGTGTPVGDPVELAALTTAFRASTDRRRFCAIGSVKTNIGHLDPAAGVAGLIKTVLALENRLLPPSLHFERANPQADFVDGPFFVNTELSEWKTGSSPRRAGISSFGVGGTNAHLVLEEAPSNGVSDPSRSPHLLVLSAKSASALAKMTANLAEHLKRSHALNLADVEHTMQVGRSAFSHRCFLVCRNIDEAVHALESGDPKLLRKGTGETKNKPVVFMFPGQGAQYVNMAQGLCEAAPAFREEIERCSKVVLPILGFDLRDFLFPYPDRSTSTAEMIDQTRISQPALFTIEYALAKLWMNWGVHPFTMIGHSLGEYVAACLAGVMSLETALTLVCVRGQLMQQTAAGSMLAIHLPHDQVQPLLGTVLSLAAVNNPSLCVVSGPPDAIETLASQLAHGGVACHQLRTSRAFHSWMMEPIVEPFAEKVRHANLQPPGIPFISNLTGKCITAEEATDPDYWVDHLRQPVRFGDGLTTVFQEADCLLLEVGPGHTLSTIAKHHPSMRSSHLVLSSMGHPGRQQSDLEFLLNTAGRLWLSGQRLDWAAMHAHERRVRVSLPTYPFEREKYWLEPRQISANPPVRVRETRRELDNWFYVPGWRRAPRQEEAGERGRSQANWLIFLDTCGVGAELAARLAQEGYQVTTVVPTTSFSRPEEQSFTLRAEHEEDYAALLRLLEAGGRFPDRIVHLWNVTANDRHDSRENGDRETFQESETHLFYGLLYLVQALENQQPGKKLSLKVVSTGLHAVTGEELLQPGKATALGLCRVIAQENPNIIPQNIDIQVASSKRAQEMLIDQLLPELVVNSSDPFIAFRGGFRWIQSFESIRLAGEPRFSRLREDGVYLITGGLGGIGLVLAEYLARSTRARLVLTGRSVFPERDEWDQWLATRPETVIAAKIGRVQKLEQLGAQVRVVAVDASDREGMREMLENTHREFGRLRGVIHAAGVTEASAFLPIRKLGRDICHRHFRPKIDGLRVLEEVLADEYLDFCVLLSSISAVLGGLGFAAYSAANAFMDAYAERHNRSGGRPWISTNWDGWLFEDGASKGAPKFFLSPQEGVEAFQRILRANVGSQIVISTGDLHARIDEWVKLSPRQGVERMFARALHSRSDRETAFVAPRNEAEWVIAEQWQLLLGIEQIGIHDDFFELGGHSLLAIQLLSRLRETFQVDFSVNLIFEAPTVAQLAVKIATMQAEEKPVQEAANLEQMLDLVEGLSESEVRAFLERLGGSFGRSTN
jgi:acyl transferase domain-containing protein/acyl carrier protein